VSKKLRKADLDVLVLQTGRHLEQAARELVPEARDPEGKPLMLGPRMYRLRDQLADEDWEAYQSWAKERNAYVHGEADSLSDHESFHNNYEQVLAALQALATDEQEEEALPVGLILLALALVCGLLIAC